MENIDKQSALRLNSNDYELRTLAGQSILVPASMKNIDFTRVVTLNESAAFLWQGMSKSTRFTISEMATVLEKEYDVDQDTAVADVTRLVEQLVKMGVCEACDNPAE